MAYIDDIVVLLPPLHASSATSVEAVATWLQERMQPLGVELNGQTSHVPFLPVTDVGTCAEGARITLERTQLEGAPTGARIVGVPVRDLDYIRRTVCNIARGEPAVLLPELTTVP